MPHIEAKFIPKADDEKSRIAESVEDSKLRELLTTMHNAHGRLLVNLQNNRLCHAWGMLACVGYTTHHWIGASVALLLALFMKD